MVTKEMACLLAECRQQSLLCLDLETAVAEARASADGICASSTNGGGGNKTSPQERCIIRLEKIEKKLTRANDRFRALACRARESIRANMEENMGRYAMLYYVEALSVEESCAAVGINEKTGRRWKDEIEKIIKG